MVTDELEKINGDLKRKHEQIILLLDQLGVLKRELDERDELLYQLKRYMGDDNFNYVINVLFRGK